MGMKKINDNYRVVVTPDLSWSGEVTPEKQRSEAIEMRDGIKRHVDNIGEIDINWDVIKTCEFCGYNWTEPDDSPHNGGCCDEDTINMPVE